MSKTFDLNIGTRKITVTAEDAAQYKDGEVTGTFHLREDGADKGQIRFDKKTWENKNTGDLSYVELEAIAEAIPLEYQ